MLTLNIDLTSAVDSSQNGSRVSHISAEKSVSKESDHYASRPTEADIEASMIELEVHLQEGLYEGSAQSFNRQIINGLPLMQIVVSSYFFINTLFDCLGCIWILKQLGLQL